MVGDNLKLLPQRYGLLSKVCVLLCIILLISMDILRLNHLTFHAYHGCLEQEKMVGNDYEIDLVMRLDLSQACASDHLDDTINYALVYEEVKKIMMQRVQLIEHLAEKIAKHLKATFPKIHEVEVHLRKMHPPIQGAVESAEVIIVR